MLPQTNGAYTVYTRLLQPLFKQHEKDLLKIVDTIKEEATKAADEVKERA